MIERKLTIFIAGLLLSASLYAQDNSVRQVYEQAESEFAIGRIDQTVDILQKNMSRFVGTALQSAYRLLILCALAEDDDPKAESYANLLLNENPYYTPSAQDPQLFAELINRLKESRTATITTASRIAESLEEAPVPVTLITEDMIRLSTATNLQELLADYVPGMTVQEGCEAVIGMRGIFTISQETILIMRDGVRLNSHISNSISADARIALSNIKQIEVLRGPASSLYGNVALAAVVNIITKSGVNGVQASIGAGNMHTLKADVVGGRHMHDADFLVWGSVYNSRGYRHDFPGDSKLDAYNIYGDQSKDYYIYVNGYNQPPAYDLGFRYNNKDFELYFSHQHGKRNSPYSLQMNSAYEYDDYVSYSGVKPGFSLKSSILNLRYDHTWGKWAVNANVTGSLESSDDHQPIFSKSYDYSSIKLYGIGADAKVIYHYPSTALGKGHMLVGMQAEIYKLYNYQMFRGLGDQDSIIAVQNYELNVDERVYSVFSQLKHEFSPHFILNAGVRFDYKKRYLGQHVNQLSPRAALIWTPSKNVNLKLTYGHSFVDLSLINRLSFLKERVEGTSEKLEIHPSKQDNVQLSASFNFPKANLRYETCFFYNNTEKIRWMDFSYITFSDFSEYSYIDSSIKSIGWENILSYERKGFKARLTTYMQRLIGSTIAIDEALLAQVEELPDPNTCPDLTIGLQLSKSFSDNLWVTANGTLQSEQHYNQFSSLIFNFNDPDFDMTKIYHINEPTYFKLDLSANYRWKMLDVSILLKNVFNKKYRLNGEQSIVMQPGRTFLGTLTVHF